MHLCVIIGDLFAVGAVVVVEDQHPIGVQRKGPVGAHHTDGEDDEQVFAQIATAHANILTPVLDRHSTQLRSQEALPAAAQSAVQAAGILYPSSKLLRVPSANQKCTHYAAGGQSSSRFRDWTGQSALLRQPSPLHTGIIKLRRKCTGEQEDLAVVGVGVGGCKLTSGGI